MAVTFVRYICSYCGEKTTIPIRHGRPMPGICTAKGKTRDGRSKPHSWRVDLRF